MQREKEMVLIQSSPGFLWVSTTTKMKTPKLFLWQIGKSFVKWNPQVIFMVFHYALNIAYKNSQNLLYKFTEEFLLGITPSKKKFKSTKH